MSNLITFLDSWDWDGSPNVTISNVAAADLEKLCVSILDWLGPGAIQKNSPKGAIQFFSADNSRCIRFDITPTTSHGQKPHINIRPGKPDHIWLKRMLSENNINWSVMEPTFNRKMSRIFSAMNHAAVFLRKQGHIHEAIEVLEAMSWGDETFEAGDYAFELGLCHEQLGQFGKAYEYFVIAERENPGVLGRADAVERVRLLIELET